MIDNDSKTYWSREIADTLGIGTSTLRKWCLLLEDKGYNFLRDEHDRRAYTEHDAIALRKMKELTDHRGMTLENAAIAVISTFNRSAGDSVTLSAPPVYERSSERHNELTDKLNELIEHTERQTAFNKALLERLDEQERRLESALKRRDEMLVQTLRDELNETKQIAAAQEDERKKGLFSRLFKR